MAKKKVADKLVLQAEPRTVLGKAVKRLRREGSLPGNIFGKDFASTAITVKAADFATTYHEAGETGVVYIHVKEEEIPTLIKSVQKHPVNDNLLHIDFRKINLNQKIETEVPVEFIGESPAAKEGAVVLFQLDKIMIEALPTDIPSSIQVDLEKLTEIGQDFKISDIPASSAYEIKDDPELVLVSLTAHKEESIEPDTTSTIPEALEGAEGEAAAAEGEEGAALAEAASGDAAPAAEEKKED